jgi:hypothetical protein
MQDSAAHRSILTGIPGSERRFRETEKVEIAKDGWRIILLHDAAAGAAGILSFPLAADFYQ